MAGACFSIESRAASVWAPAVEGDAQHATIRHARTRSALISSSSVQSAHRASRRRPRKSHLYEHFTLRGGWRRRCRPAARKGQLHQVDQNVSDLGTHRLDLLRWQRAALLLGQRLGVMRQDRGSDARSGHGLAADRGQDRVQDAVPSTKGGDRGMLRAGPSLAQVRDAADRLSPASNPQPRPP